jgi:acid phosphatase (class A)
MAGSSAQAEDEARYLATRTLAKGQRGVLANHDARLGFPHPENAFACTLGFEVEAAQMPKLIHLLQRSFTDAALATYAAKNHYNRTRPFVINHNQTCTPNDDAELAKDGSYPSGHTAIGWTFALLLTELFPERADALLKRGFEFGQSRVICGAHWQSDVTEGRVIGASVVARLHADPTFQADWMAAAAEIPAALKTASAPKRDCAWEAKALAEHPQ